MKNPTVLSSKLGDTHTSSQLIPKLHNQRSNLYLILVCVDFNYLKTTLESIKAVDPDSLIAVAVNGAVHFDLETKFPSIVDDIDQMVKDCLIDFLVVKKDNVATNLAKKELLWALNIYFFQETGNLSLKNLWTVYTDPDMPFSKDFDFELLYDSSINNGITAFGHRGGYFDYQSKGIEEYIYYARDPFVYDPKLTMLGGFTVVKTLFDYHCNYLKRGIPQFWFDDTYRSYSYLEDGAKFALIPKSWVGHYPHAASSQIEGLFNDEVFIKGKNKLKWVWIDSGVIPEIAPDPNDKEHDKEGEIY